MSSVKKEKFKAVIFDMDGVLIDSELIWFQKYHQLLALLAPSLSISVHKNLLGRSIEGIYDYLYDNYEGGLVIEDSVAGVEAGKNAKMQVLGLRNGFNHDQNLEKADKIINHLKEIIKVVC